MYYNFFMIGIDIIINDFINSILSSLMNSINELCIKSLMNSRKKILISLMKY